MQILASNQVNELFHPDYLREMSTLGALSRGGIDFLVANGRVLRLDQGEWLFRVDDPGNLFYIILQGSFRFFKHHHGKVTYIRNHACGEELGFIAMIALHTRRGSAQAGEASVVLEITSQLFNRLHRELPTDFGLLPLNLARGMARRIRELNNLLVDHDADP